MPNKTPTPTHRFPDLDRLDRRILNALQTDGRMSNLKLAENIGLSATAVLARVQRLNRDHSFLATRHDSTR